MKLSITDRMVLVQILGSEAVKGNLLLLKLVDDVTKKLPPNEHELKHIEYKAFDNGSFQYNLAKAQSKITDIPMPSLVHSLIVRHIEAMNRSESLTLAMKTTSEKFIKLTDEETKFYATESKG